MPSHSDIFSQMTATHPIACLSRSDGDISTCYHSFYWMIISPDGRVDVTARIPSATSDIDIVEQGLHIFISDIHERGSLRKESCGNFVLTSSDGSRFYAFWCGLQSRVFVAVSRFPHLSCSRQLVALLGNELTGSIKAQLLTLCETPILPTCGLTYVLQFNTGSVKLDFNSCEQVNDNDVNMIPITIFSPQMFVAAWESILLERKVLLISVSPSVISPCCEFLRRLMLPLNLVNTFVPLLPRQLINAIEAPFPYLCGAETSSVLGSDVDLSNIVLVDLDLRTVTMPEISSENPDVSVPKTFRVQLLKDLTDIMLRPFTNWVERPATIIRGSDAAYQSSCIRPASEDFQSIQADQITQLFVTANLSVLTARDCTIKAFFRRVGLHENGIFCPEICRVSLQKLPTPYCFDLRYGVAYGCLQLLREDKDDPTLHFTTCWVEVDNYCMAVYQHADQLPVLFINCSDIRSASPSTKEPLGHVFEVEICQLVRHTYCFVATDIGSRSLWMSFVESKRKKKEKDDIPSRSHDSSHFAHTNPMVGTGVEMTPEHPSSRSEKVSPRIPSLSTPSPPTSGSVSRSSVILGPGSTSHSSAYEEMFKIGYLRKTPQFDLKLLEGTSLDSGNGSGSGAVNPPSEGPRSKDSTKQVISSVSFLSHEEEVQEALSFSLFRSNVMNTQMVASLGGQLTLDCFEPVLSRIKSVCYSPGSLSEISMKRSETSRQGSTQLINCFINSTIGGFIWRRGTVLGLMDHVRSEGGIGDGSGNGAMKKEFLSVLEMLEEGELLNEIAAQRRSGTFVTTPTDSENSLQESDDDDDSLMGTEDPTVFDDIGEDWHLSKPNDRFKSNGISSAIKDALLASSFSSHEAIDVSASVDCLSPSISPKRSISDLNDLLQDLAQLSNDTRNNRGGGYDNAKKDSPSKPNRSRSESTGGKNSIKKKEIFSFSDDDADPGSNLDSNEIISGFMRIQSVFYAKKSVMNESRSELDADQSHTTFDDAKCLGNDQGSYNRSLSRTKSNVSVHKSERFKWVVMCPADVVTLKKNITFCLQQSEEALNKIIVEDRMELTASIVRKQQQIEAKTCTPFSHQISISISSCVTAKEGHDEGYACSNSKGENWFDHMWNVISVNQDSAPTSSGKLDNDNSGESVVISKTEMDSSCPTPICESNGAQTSPGKSEIRTVCRAEEASSEASVRTEIKVNLLVLFEMQLLCVTGDPLRQHLVPVLQSMIGRLHDRLGNFESALKYYSEGKFVSQRRIMKCLAQKYVSFTEESLKKNALLDVSVFLKWAHSLGPAIGLQAFRLTAEVLLKEVQPPRSCGISSLPGSGSQSQSQTPQHPPPLARSNAGNRSSDTISSLKLNLSGVKLVSAMSSSVLNNMSICESNRGEKAVAFSIELLSDLKALLQSSFGHDKDSVKSSYDKAAIAPSANVQIGAQATAQSTSSFSTYFTRPTSPLPPASSSSAWYTFSPSPKPASKVGGDKSLDKSSPPSPVEDHARLGDGARPRAATTGTDDRLMGTIINDYVDIDSVRGSRENDDRTGKSVTLKPISISTAPNTPNTGSKISFQGATGDRSPEVDKNTPRRFVSVTERRHSVPAPDFDSAAQSTYGFNIDVTNDQVATVLDRLISLPVFQIFELKTCQLQKISLSNLSADELFVFFSNVYNTLFVHATIVQCARSKKNAVKPLDRLNFLRATKYCVANMLFSLFDIEYSILRASSEKPRDLATFFSSSTAFPRSDPRRVFALPRAMPLVSFILCTPSPSSPLMYILLNPANLRKELLLNARSYIEHNVNYDINLSTIILPGIFETYWKDFCAVKSEVVKSVIALSPKRMAADLQVILDSKRMKISFNAMYGRPTIII